MILRLAGADADAAAAIPGDRPISPTARSPAAANICAPAWCARTAPPWSPAYPHDGAGILSSIVQSDGFVVLGEDIGEVAPGMTVDFLPFSEVFA